jgi:hypothetical protein
MNKLKVSIAQKLKSKMGLEADMQLLGALVNICVALRKAAVEHTMESKDLLLIQDEFEAALLELMNCPSMDMPENVTRVLRKRYVEHDVVPDHVIRARTLCSGPLDLCVDNDLTKILSTAQIKTFVNAVFYTPLKQTTSLPVRSLLDIFQLRSGSNNSRYRPFVMFALECALMPMLCLSMVLFLAVARSPESCVGSVWESLDFMCAHYYKIQSMLCVYLVGRIFYELGEINYTFVKYFYTDAAVAAWKMVENVYDHMFSDKWNVLDMATILCLSLWVRHGCTSVRILTWAMISLCLGLLRFVSLNSGTGQLIIMIFAMAKDLMPFVYILLVSMFGFGLAFHCQFPQHKSFSSFKETMIVLFDAAIGDHDFEIFDGDSVGIAMMIGYIVLLSLVLLNLVVARMSATHERLDASAMEVWSRAQALNAEEFLLLKDRKPLCMLPPPLNIVATLIWIVFDIVPHCFQEAHGLMYYLQYWDKQLRLKSPYLVMLIGCISPAFIKVASTIVLKPAQALLHLCSPAYYQLKNAYNSPRPNKSTDSTAHAGDNDEKGVLFCAGTFSDVVIAIITSPFHAVVEVYLAYRQASVGVYRSYFTALLVALFPVWILCYIIMIICNALRFQDTTIVTSVYGGQILLTSTPFVSAKPGYFELCTCVLLSSMCVLRYLCPLHYTGIQIAVSRGWVDFSAEGGPTILAVLQTLYHSVMFHATVYVILLVLIVNAYDHYQGPAKDKKAEMGQGAGASYGDYDSYLGLIENKWLHVARLCLYSLISVYDLQLLYLAEMTELIALGGWILTCVYTQHRRVHVSIHSRDHGHHDTEEMSAKEFGWTDVHGRTKKEASASDDDESEAETKVILEIKVIRASLNSKGLTIFGTSTHPFVVVKYLRSKLHADMDAIEPEPQDALHDEGEVFYTKTVTVNAHAPEFNQSFEFVLRKNDLEIEFKVYDRVGEHVRYMYGATCDIREWIANRRFESPVILRDSLGRMTDDSLQIVAKVRFSKSNHSGAHPQSVHRVLKTPSTETANSTGSSCTSKPIPLQTPPNAADRVPSSDSASGFLERRSSSVSSVGSMATYVVGYDPSSTGSTDSNGGPTYLFRRMSSAPLVSCKDDSNNGAADNMVRANLIFSLV